MSRRVDKILIDALTALNVAGYIGPAETSQCQEFGFDVEFDHTSAAGVVVIETAADNNYPTNYAGTWAILATVTWAAIDKSHHVAIAGSFRSLRARISSAVTSGTVTVRATANGNPT